MKPGYNKNQSIHTQATTYTHTRGIQKSKKKNHGKLTSWKTDISQIPVISKGNPSIVPKVPEIDIISSTMSLFVCVSGSEIVAGLTRRLSLGPLLPLMLRLALLQVSGSLFRIRSQWSRHMSARSQSSSSLTRRRMLRNASTLARHDRATSASVVSRAQRTRRVAVDVRWKALSVGWFRIWQIKI